MAQTLKIRRSATASAVPTIIQLSLGELAMNTYDGKLYMKKNVSGTETIVDITGVGSLSFGTTGLTPSAATTGAITVAGTLVAANGGTGQSTYAIGDILYASAATTLAKLADVATGSVLISGGVGAAPSYGKVGLTTHISGVLPVANGGTNLASYAVGDILYASAATTIGKLADVATGNVLISGGVGVAPSYGKVGLATHVSGTLPVANGGTNLASYAVGDLLYASAATTIGKLADVATGNVLISGGVGVAPSYGKVGLTTHVSGTLPVANGGTGIATLTAGYIPFGAGTSAFNSSANLFWDNTNGRLGIGTAAPFSYLEIASTVPSSATTATGFRSSLATQAATFTITSLTHFAATQGVFGAGSTINEQYGYLASSNLTGATNNYGFVAALPSGTNRFNFYASGTADNYFAGNLGLGIVPTVRLDVAGSIRISGGNSYRWYSASGSTDQKYWDMIVNDDANAVMAFRAINDAFTLANTWLTVTRSGYQPSVIAFFTGSSVERLRIDESGNVGIGTTSFGTSAAKVLALGNATAPTTGPADTLQIFSSDLSAGNTMLSLRTEGTPVNANTTAAATHRIAVRINGTVYYLLANTAA